MKKRIISFALVVVMALLALAGCGYSYEKDDMSNYADFDMEAFFAALSELEIEDGDFGTDWEARWVKVNDKIFKSLADTIVKEMTDEDKKTEGTPGKYDVVYYNYYYTAEVPVLDENGKETDEKEIAIFAFDTGMNLSKAVKLQLGISTLEGLDEKIANKLLALDFTGKAYSTISDRKTEEGDRVYISYTKEFDVKTTTSEGVETTERGGESANYTVIDLAKVADGEAATLASSLIGKDLNSNITGIKVKEIIDGEEVEVSYTSLKIHWIVENEGAYETVVDEKPYTDKKEVKDINGKARNLKDADLTYYVYPTYYVSVPSELTAEIVLNDIFGKSITATSLECFENEIYKYENEDGETVTLADLVKKLAEYHTDLETAESDVTKKQTAVDTAQKEYDAAKEALDAAPDDANKQQAESSKKTLLTQAKEKLTEAEEKRDEAQANVDKTVANIFKCAETEDMMKQVIVEDYEQSQYDALKATYESTIKKNLAAAIYEIVEKTVVIKHDADGNAILPEKAFKAAFNRLWDNYEARYYESSGEYEGAPSSGAQSNYKYYNDKYGSDGFNEYLKYVIEEDYPDYKFDLVGKDMQKVYDALGWVAADAISTRVRLYYLVDFISEKFGEDVSVTEEQIDEFKGTIYYTLLVYSAGGDEANVEEDDYVPALLADNIFNFFLTVTEDEAEDSAEKDLKIKYEHIDYDFKDTEEKE